MVPTKILVSALGLAIGGFLLAPAVTAATNDQLRAQYVSACIAHSKTNDLLAPEDQRNMFCGCRFDYLAARLKPKEIEDLVALAKAQTNSSALPDVPADALASDDAAVEKCLQPPGQ